VKREDKEMLVKELSEFFSSCDNFYLVDFMNMSVAQAVELRRLCRENNYTFRVIKNRLALRAFKEEFPEELKEFSTRNKVLNFKAGLLEGQLLNADSFNEVAKLTSRNDLLARLGGLMAAPLMRLLRTWQAPLSGFGTLLSQLKSKK
jgi:large subunit ribosomal protein L10